jgi:hypothetical protein
MLRLNLAHAAGNAAGQPVKAPFHAGTGMADKEPGPSNEQLESVLADLPQQAAYRHQGRDAT